MARKKRVSVTLTDELRDWVDRVSAQKRWSDSQFISWLVECAKAEEDPRAREIPPEGFWNRIKGYIGRVWGLLCSLLGVRIDVSVQVRVEGQSASRDVEEKEEEVS